MIWTTHAVVAGREQREDLAHRVDTTCHVRGADVDDLGLAEVTQSERSVVHRCPFLPAVSPPGAVLDIAMLTFDNVSRTQKNRFYSD
jgi:hypothetical protein